MHTFRYNANNPDKCYVDFSSTIETYTCFGCWVLNTNEIVSLVEYISIIDGKINQSVQITISV